VTAYVLNLQGRDIIDKPVFHGYLFIGLERVVLFVDPAKVNEDVAGYLRDIGIERKEYIYIWQFLRRREWGEGKVRPFRFPSQELRRER
jgi:Xaa-Pro aminopeptidase